MNNPSLGRPYRYEVDSALRAIEQENERQEQLAESVRLGHIRGPFLVPTRKPVLVVTHKMLVLLGLPLLVIAAYGMFRLLFPNM
jgi:hypothetical protein